MSRPDFRRTELTCRALEALRDLPQGHCITYDRLAEAIGADPQAEARTHVDSARHILKKEGVGVFDPIIDVGIKHLTDQEVAHKVAVPRQKRVRNQARYAMVEASRVLLVNLTREEQAQLTAALANHGVVLHMTNPNYLREQRQAVFDTRPPDLGLPPEIPQ